MYLRKSILKYYSQFLLLYLLILALAFILIARQDNTAFLNGGDYSSRSLSLIEIIVYYIYQFVLNFPLSIFNWFSDRYLYTTYYFILPNSLAVAWIIGKIMPFRQKEISQTMYYLLILFGLVIATVVSYSFVQMVLAD